MALELMLPLMLLSKPMPNSTLQGRSGGLMNCAEAGEASASIAIANSGRTETLQKVIFASSNCGDGTSARGSDAHIAVNPVCRERGASVEPGAALDGPRRATDGRAVS